MKVGISIFSKSLDELKQKIDRLSNKIPIELMTEGLDVSSKVSIVETYKGFKIREWHNDAISGGVIYDTAYEELRQGGDIDG